jgi:hypothetical protein
VNEKRKMYELVVNADYGLGGMPAQHRTLCRSVEEAELRLAERRKSYGAPKRVEYLILEVELAVVEQG